MRLVAALLVLAIIGGGCANDDKPSEERGLSGTCGLRKIGRDVKERRVPKEFLLEGVEIARTQDFRGRFIATVNAPYGVDDAYRSYLKQVKEAGWDIVTHETEGFEAEIYLSNRRYMAGLSIRTSTCEGKVVVYASILDRTDLPTNN